MDLRVASATITTVDGNAKDSFALTDLKGRKVRAAEKALSKLAVNITTNFVHLSPALQLSDAAADALAERLQGYLQLCSPDKRLETCKARVQEAVDSMG
jgi:hypothetical protein